MSDKLGITAEINFEPYDKVNAKLENLLKKLQKANKLDIEVNTETFQKLQNQFNQLKNKMESSFKINSDTTGVTKTIDGIISNMDKLDKKTLKIVDGKTVQLTEQVRKNLLETQRIITDLNTGSKTVFKSSDFAQAQTSLYKQLNTLQKDEFAIKQRLIGADGEIKNQLEQQLSLIKQQQGEAAKTIVNNKLQSDDGINSYLIKRKELLSDLSISQEKYNQKQINGEIEVQTKIKQYQDSMKVQIQNLQTKYKDLVPKDSLVQFQNALNKLNATSMGALKNEIKDLDNQFKQMTADTKAKGINIANQDARGLSSLLTKDIVAFASWKVIGDAVMMAYRSIGDSIKFVYDMDSAMINLRKITEETSETYRNFEIQSNRVATSLARGTTEVVDATVAWKKAGYSLNESQKLAETTLIGANVGDVDVNSIQEYLVAPLKAWKIQAEDSIGILNIMNNVSNQHAVTIQDLGASYARASSVMAMANNTLEETTALVTAAQAQTQMGGETIGSGLRTIALRLTQMKDEEGNIIPKLAEDFDAVGVHIKDANGNLNSTYEIIKQLNKAWTSGNLTQDQKLNLLEKGAGKMRSNILAAMIENFGEAEKTLQDSLNSANSAINEQEAYLTSLEARVKIFRETLNSLYQKMVTSDSLKSFVDGATSVVGVIGTLTDTVGFLPLVIGTTTMAFALFNKELTGTAVMSFAKSITLLPHLFTITSAETGVATTKMMWFGAVLDMTKVKAIATKVAMAGVFGVATLGITLAITAFAGFIDKLIVTNKELKEMNQQMKDSYNNSIKTANDAQDSLNRKKEIEEILKGSVAVEERTKLETELYDIKSKLGELLPGAVTKLNAEGKAIAENNKLIQQQIDLEKERAKQTANDYLKKNGGYNPFAKNIQDKATQTQSDIDLYGQMKLASAQGKTSFDRVIGKDEVGKDIVQTVKVSQDALSKLKMSIEENKLSFLEWNMMYSQASDEAKQQYQSYDDLVQSVNNMSGATNSNTEAENKNTNAKEDNVKATENQADALKKTQDAFNESINKGQELNDILAELNENHKLSGDSVQKIASSYPQLLGYLGDEKGMREQLTSLIQQEENVQRSALYNMLKDNETFYNEKIKGHDNVINQIAKGYGIDISNAQSMAQARQLIEKKLIESLSSMWAGYFRMSADGLASVNYSAITDSVYGAGSSQDNWSFQQTPELAAKMSAANQAVNSYNQKMKDLASQFENVAAKFSGFNAKTINLSGIGNKSSGAGGSDAQKAAEDAAKAREEAENAMKDSVKTVEDAITEIIKKEVDRRKKLIEDEYEARKDAVNKAKELYNETNEEDDYQKELKKEQETLNQINTSIVNAQRDTSLAGQSRLEDLIKQQQEQQDKIDEMILNRTRDKNNDMFDKQLDALDKEQETKITELENQYSDENISKMVNKALITGQIDGIGSVADAYKNFQNTYNQGLTASGKIMEDEFISKWREVQKLINGTAGVSIGVNFSGLERYKDGGINTTTGLAFLDGTSSDPELITNGKQAINMLRNLSLKPIQTPSVNPIRRANGASVQFNEPFMIIQNVSSDVDMDSLVNKATDKVTRAIMQTYNDMGIYEH